MDKVKTKIFFKVTLFVLSIYLPLLVFSIYSQFYRSLSKSPRQKIWDEMNIAFQKQRISEAKSGYLPEFIPLRTKKYLKGRKLYPIGSLPYTKTVLCNEGYGVVKYKTDRFGLRNRDSKWLNVQEQENIFVIGDSMVNGECVPNGETITGNIQSKKEINTLSLGSGGNGPYQYKAILKSIISPIVNSSENMNWVVLIIYPNDNIGFNQKEENLLIKASPIISNNETGAIVPTKQYQEFISSLINENYPISKEEIIKRIKIEKFKRNIKSYVRIFSLYPIRRRLNIIYRLNHYNQTNNKSFSPSEKAIKLLGETCKNNCKPMVVYIPNSNFWDANEMAEKYKNEINTISKNIGITFLDGSYVIDNNNLSDYAPKGIHLSKEGYKKISDLISNEIIN